MNQDELEDGKLYLCRVLQTVRLGNAHNMTRMFQEGQEVRMYYRDNPGSSAGPSWWSNFDLDGAFIFLPHELEAIEKVEE